LAVAFDLQLAIFFGYIFHFIVLNIDIKNDQSYNGFMNNK